MSYARKTRKFKSKMQEVEERMQEARRRRQAAFAQLPGFYAPVGQHMTMDDTVWRVPYGTVDATRWTQPGTATTTDFDF
jgi:hypothetical protein